MMPTQPFAATGEALGGALAVKDLAIGEAIGQTSSVDRRQSEFAQWVDLGVSSRDPRFPDVDLLSW